MSGYQDQRWQKLRLQILERDAWQCIDCGAKNKTLHVHHKAYHGELWATPPDQLETLCAECHAQAEFFKAITKAQSMLRVSWPEMTANRAAAIEAAMELFAAAWFYKDECCLEVLQKLGARA